jgi:hypothetical protein
MALGVSCHAAEGCKRGVVMGLLLGARTI